MEFHSVFPKKSLPDKSYKLVAKTWGDFDMGSSSEEEIDYTAACALNAGHDVHIFELRKPWWTWSHYYLFVKEAVNDIQERR